MIEAQFKKEVSHLIKKLKDGKGIHEKLKGNSLIHIDRPLPFVCIYRFPKGINKSAHAKLIDTQPSFILMQQEDEEALRHLMEALTKIIRRRFGSVLILEVWASSDLRNARPERAESEFNIFCSHKECMVTAETLEKELCGIPVVQRLPHGQVSLFEESFPAERTMLIPGELAGRSGVQYIGIEVEPFYYDQPQNQLYPMLFRAFRKEFAIALKKTFFEFVRLQTRHEVSHYHGLGRQREDELVWQVDQELVDISTSFDFLLLVTITNHEEAWEKFAKSKFNTAPTFQYRLLPVNPDKLKRRLYNIPIEDVDDPTLSYIFRDKRNEVDRMLNMILERETPHFKYSSIQVFGGVEEELHQTARKILSESSRQQAKAEGEEEGELISAEEFADLGRKEIEFLRGQYPALDATVQIRDDIEGLMVSQGQLLVDHHFQARRSRAEALIQHEVGTHVLTYYNGKAQPLKQLYAGTPGYEDLQEGLAVLAEYLVGGLSIGRLRTLAARVVAVKSMLEGADFIQTFRLLHKEWDFEAEAAFSLTARIYRGGGLTKDAVYLKGLIELLKYLSSGGKLEPLLIGKIRQDYIPFIEELMNRKILRPSPLRPRYFSNLESMEKLKKLNGGATVFNLIS